MNNDTEPTEWLYNSSEDGVWNGDRCDSRAAAVASAGPGLELEDGATFYTGRVVRADPPEFYKGLACSVVESIQEHLYETVPDEVNTEFTPTPEQEADLARQLEAWVTAVGISCFTIVDVEEHTFERCDAAAAPGAVYNSGAHVWSLGRCTLHDGHEDGHAYEWLDIVERSPDDGEAVIPSS